MSERKTDPLLLAAKIVVGIANAFTAFGAVMVVIGIGGVLTVARSEVVTSLAEAGAPPHAYWVIIGALAIVVAILAMIAVFLQYLYNIVRSVDQEGPFEPANADRLARMGWLSVAGHLLTIPLGAIGGWFSQFDIEPSDRFDFEFGIGGGGIVLTLVLFILARVFRQGAAMREDLEGTV